MPRDDLDLRCNAKDSQDFIWESESCLYALEIFDSEFLLMACAGVTVLPRYALEDRIVRPRTLRAVTSFAEPEKSLNAMEGFAIIFA